LLHELHAQQMRYLLVVGYAVRYYECLRTKRDLDSWLATDRANAAKVCELCRGVFDWPDLPVEPFATVSRSAGLKYAPARATIHLPVMGARPRLLAELTGSNVEINILAVQSGVDFGSCYAARVTANLDRTRVGVVSLPHLKIIKGVSPAREKDGDDLAHLP
jgi:hypothetical protein